MEGKYPYEIIKTSGWKREQQFNFFRDFEVPYFGLTANVNVEHLQTWCRNQDKSFSLSMIYLALNCINEIDELRLRLAGDEVRLYNRIDAGATILKEDDTFIYCTIEFEEDLESFLQKAKQSIEEQKEKRGFTPHDRPDMAFFSVIPWVHFSSIQHAMNKSSSECIPRLVIGKYELRQGKSLLPVALQVHHALADGYHVGKFYELLQEKLDRVAQWR